MSNQILSNFSIISLIGIALIIIEIYAPRFADKLEIWVIEFPRYIMDFTKRIFVGDGGKYITLQLVCWPLIIISGILLFNDSDIISTVSFWIWSITMWILAAPTFVAIWGSVLEFILKLFDYIVKGKALAGVGLCLTIIDGLI